MIKFKKMLQNNNSMKVIKENRKIYSFFTTIGCHVYVKVDQISLKLIYQSSNLCIVIFIKIYFTIWIIKLVTV